MYQRVRERNLVPSRQFEDVLPAHHLVSRLRNRRHDEICQALSPQRSRADEYLL